jgi:hypothetical protein
MRFVHDRKSFLEVLERWQVNHDKQLNKKRRIEVDTLRKEEELFSLLLDRVEGLMKERNPLETLKSAYNDVGGIIGEIYYLQVGYWRAYYYVNPEARLCVGLLVCKEDASFDDKLQMLSDAARRNK